MMYYFNYSLYATFLIETFLIFGKWKIGGEKWLKIAPKLFYCLTIFVYIVVPLIYFLIIIATYGSISKSLYGLSFIALSGMALLRIPFYFLVIRR